MADYHSNLTGKQIDDTLNSIIKLPSGIVKCESGTIQTAIPNKDYASLSDIVDITIYGAALEIQNAEVPHLFRNGNLGLLTFNFKAKMEIPAWTQLIKLPSNINVLTNVRSTCLLGPAGNLKPVAIYVYNTSPVNVQLETTINKGDLLMGSILLPVLEV